MSIDFRVGLTGERGLTRDELAIAMRAMGVSCVIELAAGELVELSLREEGLVEGEVDPGTVPSLRRFFERGTGAVPSPIASAAELCVLLPGECDAKFGIARRIPGVDGWTFKSLAVALAEVEGHCQDTGEAATDLIRILDRAEELAVGVIFGERGGVP